MTQQTSQPGVPGKEVTNTTAPQVTSEAGKNQAAANVAVISSKSHPGVITKNL